MLCAAVTAGLPLGSGGQFAFILGTLYFLDLLLTTYLALEGNHVSCSKEREKLSISDEYAFFLPHKMF